MSAQTDRQQRPTMVLVDAFSTGAMLAREAAGRYRVVHVRSRALVPDTFAASLPTEVFEEDLTYPGHTEEVLRRLAELRPVGVIPASEFGVEAADEIAGRLGLRGNDPARSAARRDKFRMMEALSAAGVRTSRQCQGADLERLLNWRRTAGLERVVVKPLDSAGSDDVYTCDTDEEVTEAFEAIIGKTNLMLRANETVLVQEYLDGDEYIINTVSRDAKHWFTDAWISRKTVGEGKRKIYDLEDLLAPGDPAIARIFPYVADCLDALGITDGPAHSELILTADGPVLLETGARVSGLANPAALDRCTGANQVSLTLDCYTPGADTLTSRPVHYPQLEQARCVNLIARREVPLDTRAIREALRKLPAFESVRFRVAESAHTRRTVDLNSSPGAVFLVHVHQAEIDRAYKELRELEHELL
ncbi:ATP-grasp domain-containing protein [Streptomyces sp. NPDC048514]|uniref:ATP-grasp domain-containing protein n=1 Tax=Streptomyces sp. NPDC048514 TaxID=3365564 RepID=UPI003714CC9C